MNELDHDDLRYSGQQGETASISISLEPINTVQLVSYTVHSQQRSLTPGRPIQFQLGPENPTVLQLNLDSVPPNGKFTVVLRTVDNEANHECVHVWQRHGLVITKDFRFFL